MSKNLSNPQDDLRVRRTRKRLWEAFLALLDERLFEEISITDICAQAMVNRTTFYNHFESKHDLLIYGIKHEQEILDKQFCQARTTEERRQVIVQVFEHIAAHQHYYIYLLMNNMESLLTTLLRRQAAEQLETKLAEHVQNNGHHFHIPLPIIAQFYAGALFELGIWWLENRMPISAEELAGYWFQLCQGKEPLSII